MWMLIFNCSLIIKYTYINFRAHVCNQQKTYVLTLIPRKLSCWNLMISQHNWKKIKNKNKPEAKIIIAKITINKINPLWSYPSNMCLSRPTFLLHCKTAEMSSSLKPRITKILIIGIIHNLILMRWSVTWHQTVTFPKCGKPPGRKLPQRHLIFVLFLSVFLPHFLLSAHCFATLWKDIFLL